MTKPGNALAESVKRNRITDIKPQINHEKNLSQLRGGGDSTKTGWISLQDAARFENKEYSAMRKRIRRAPERYAVQCVPRPEGGKPLVFVAVSSLSPAAQQRYWREQADTVARERAATQEAPAKEWYETADSYRFRQEHAAEFAEKAELVHKLRACTERPRSERRVAYEELAAELGVDVRTIQRYVKRIDDARERARQDQLERGDGFSRDMEFQILSLCRKPRGTDTFPSLTDEVKALAQNIFADVELTRNKPTIRLMTEQLFRQAIERGLEPLPGENAVENYFRFLGRTPEYRDARNLAEVGRREYENRFGMKGRRNARELRVMELVMGDVHTLDLWAVAKDGKGHDRAIRPQLAAWLDVKTRRIMGATLCVHANFDVLKQSFFRLVYRDAGSVPRWLYIDNGKDYTAKAMMGRSKKERREDAGGTDAERNGFYKQMGVEAVTTAIPYHAWSKGNLERSFRTLIEGFSKCFTSYTGTLTGSKTSDKIPKDIDAMFRAGKLPRIEEVEGKLLEWLDRYHTREHEGLKDAGEAYTKPLELFENGDKCVIAPPPKEYARELMMTAERARVQNDGIHRFRNRYFDAALGPYVGHDVEVRYDPDDLTRLYVYDLERHMRICVAEKARDLGYMNHSDSEELAEHRRMQNRQIQNARDTLDWLRMPYEERIAGEKPKRRTKSLDGLMLEGDGTLPDITALPNDAEWRNGYEERQRRTEKRRGYDNYLFDRYTEERAITLEKIMNSKEAY